MSNGINNRLANLLEHQRNNDTVSGYTDELTNSVEGINVVIPLKQAVDIYSVRSKINSELAGGRIKGYEMLLPALGQTNVSNVRITELESGTKIYLVFTDVEYFYLFGVLDIPKKQAD